MEFGFNDGVIFDNVPDQREADLLKGLGATVHRFTLNWRGVERIRGRYDFSPYDPVYPSDLRNGIRPLIILAFAPDWSWAPGVQCRRSLRCPYPPAAGHLDAWKRMVTKVVHRYPRMVALEIWNEPNLTAFWAPYPDPRGYVQLVRAARRALRSAGSSIPVLAGSLAGAPIVGGSDRNGVAAASYLDAMYRHGASGVYDGLSIHPYPHGLNLSYLFNTLRGIEDARARNDDRAPLWITEVGASTGGQVSETQQAALLVRIVETLATRKDVRALLLHTLVNPFPGYSREAGFGIVHGDGAPKPAYCALANLRMRAPVNCDPPPLLGLFTDQLQEWRWDAQISLAAAVDAAAAHARDHGGSLAEFSTGRPSPSPAQEPGPSADPRRVGHYRFGEETKGGALLCAASRADTSYCAMYVGGRWSYGHAVGAIGAAADATIKQTSRSW